MGKGKRSSGQKGLGGTGGAPDSFPWKNPAQWTAAGTLLGWAIVAVAAVGYGIVRGSAWVLKSVANSLLSWW